MVLTRGKEKLLRMQTLELRRWLREQLKKVRTRDNVAARIKLTIEPVPKTLANQSLSKQLGNRWKKISKEERARYDHKCAVCEVAPGKGRLHCHEIWEYDDAACVQKLSGFVALCDPCHRVKHGVWIKHLADGFLVKRMDLTSRLVSYKRQREWLAAKYKEELRLPEDQREPGMLEALAKQANAVMPCEHFLRVNGCDIEAAERHIIKAAKKWRRRSRQKWRVDYGEYAELLPSTPRTPS